MYLHVSVSTLQGDRPVLQCLYTGQLLQAAVFPPQFRNLDDPQLELFDLDEAFSSEKSRLAQITNKCGEEDLEYYIR